MAKYSQKLIDDVHQMKILGKSYNQISDVKSLTFNQVTYILHKKIPSKQKSLDELYVQADEATKEADSVLKRVKRRLFGG